MKTGYYIINLWSLILLCSLTIIIVCVQCKPQTKIAGATESIFIHTYYPFYNDSTLDLVSILDDTLFIYKRGDEFLYENNLKDWQLKNSSIVVQSNINSSFFYCIKDSVYGILYNPISPKKIRICKSDSVIRSFGETSGPTKSDSMFSMRLFFNNDSTKLKKLFTSESKYLKGAKDTITYFYSFEMNDTYYNMSGNSDLNFSNNLKLFRMEMNFFLPEHPVEKTREKFKGFVGMTKVSLPRPKRQIDSIFTVMKTSYQKYQ